MSNLLSPAAAELRRRASRAGSGGLLAWAADRGSAGPRRWLQIALGVAWLLDAALQYQPFMFTRGFVTQILDPAGVGSPAVISHSVTGAGQILLSHVAVFNALFATVQLALGAGLLWRRTSRAALAGTIGWALAVWWLGEGLGGILTGSATPVTGAPGAAVLYAIIAVLAWPPRPGRQPPDGGHRSGAASSIAGGSRIGLRGAQLGWAAVWVSSAYFVVQAPDRTAGALHDTVAALAGGEPGWIAALDRAAAGAIGSGGTAVSVALAVVFLIIAAGVLVPALLRPALILAALAALLIWAVGEDFGEMLTGQGTDPSTGPLLILLAAASWPLSRSRRVASQGRATLPPTARTGGPGQAPADRPQPGARPR